ncbi:MAG: branched-chain amino acid ABC transporter permease [Acidimicrobiia bacterium]|nr:MAG: branched-chain amino acid ABC transporter permease [Acidimicrobiia bacterium]
MTQIIQVVIFGLLLGGVYALMASGLTLAFGVMRIVNLAHAVFIIGSAYIAFFAFDKLGIDPLLSVVFIMPLLFVFGVGLYMALFTRIEGTARYVEMTVLLTFGLAIMIEGLLGWGFTGIFRQATPAYLTDAFFIGDFLIPTGQFIAAMSSFLLLIGLWGFLRFTRIGYGIRATMQNRAAAQLVGVNVRRVSAIAFGISTALAGASGALMSYLFPFFPFRHWQWIAVLLALVVLGGMGSLKGVVVGALILGVANSLVVDQIGPGWAWMAFYAALFFILLVRPNGLFGKEVAA